MILRVPENIGNQDFLAITPPISEELLIQFIAYLNKYVQVQYSTIKLYLCGVRYHYIRHGVVSPLQSKDANVRIYNLLNSVKRNKRTKQINRLPIDISVLSRLVSYLNDGCFGHHDDGLMKSCCTLAHIFGFMRCG